jgi:recombination protein RecA
MTNDDKRERLELTVKAIQARYGHLSLRPLSPQPEAIAHLPTGFPPLDQALGIGGLPCGQMSELISIPSAGATTMALTLIAQAQARGPVIYLDIDQSFDPVTATQLGVDVKTLLLVEPHSWRDACAIMRDFILAGSSSLLLFDSPAHLLWQPDYGRSLTHTLDRLNLPLGKTDSVLLFLISLLPHHARPDQSVSSQVIHPALAHYAAVRLVVYRTRWRYGRRDVGGYEAKVYIAKNKLAAARGPVNLTLTLNDEEGNGKSTASK